MKLVKKEGNPTGGRPKHPDRDTGKLFSLLWLLLNAIQKLKELSEAGEKPSKSLSELLQGYCQLIKAKEFPSDDDLGGLALYVKFQPMMQKLGKIYANRLKQYANALKRGDKMPRSLAYEAALKKLLKSRVDESNLAVYVKRFALSVEEIKSEKPEKAAQRIICREFKLVSYERFMKLKVELAGYVDPFRLDGLRNFLLEFFDEDAVRQAVFILAQSRPDYQPSEWDKVPGESLCAD